MNFIWAIYWFQKYFSLMRALSWLFLLVRQENCKLLKFLLINILVLFKGGMWVFNLLSFIKLNIKKYAKCRSAAWKTTLNNSWECVKEILHHQCWKWHKGWYFGVLIIFQIFYSHLCGKIALWIVNGFPFWKKKCFNISDCLCIYVFFELVVTSYCLPH